MRYTLFFLMVCLWGIPLAWGQGTGNSNTASEPTPAVVHPAILSPCQQVLSLRGDWDFSTLSEPWDAEQLPPVPKEIRAISVPGCWAAQGVGEPGMSQTWDISGDCNPRPLRHVYMGTAWYRKTVSLPNNWQGQEIWLKVGGVRTEALFYINGHRLGSLNTYCGSYKYRITDWIQADEPVEIVALVRNDTPSRKGQMCDFHRFGGFYRDVELEATPSTWIDDVWVQGRLPNESTVSTEPTASTEPATLTESNEPGTARVHFTLDTTTPGQQAEVSIILRDQNANTITEETQTVSVTPGQELTTEIPVPNVKTWSPEHPVLYQAEVTLTLADGQRHGQRHGWVERFGFRKLEVRGDRFFLNGKPYFLRGYGETFIYPETLISPPDRETHLKNMAVVRACGFTFARMHTHCEIPEYFEAADEQGIMIQPELPYYQDRPTEAFDFDPARDLQELWRHYRRYTSFAVYSMGNEGHLGSPVDEELYRWCKENDPDRPVQHQDGGLCTPENSDFTTSVDGSPGSIILPWNRGQFDDFTMPFLAHEYMNQSVMLDPRLEPKFTGAIPSPVSMAVYENALQEVGLTREQGDACIRAAHTLQAYYNKSGLEQARRDPACDGYSFWNFIDQMVIQNGVYTSQGCLNAFYEQKNGGCPIDEFQEFNGPTAILAEWPNDVPILTDGETFHIDWWLSHFDEKTIPSGTLQWTILDNKTGQEIDHGEISIDNLPPGSVSVVGTTDVPITGGAQPREWTLTAKLAGTDIQNHWSLWYFPQRTRPTLSDVVVSPELRDRLAPFYNGLRDYGSPDMTPDDLLIASPDEPVYTKAVQEGRRILAIRPATGDPSISLGWWGFGPQLGTAFFDHPLWGDFPRDATLSPLWFRMLKSDSLDIKDNQIVKDWQPLILDDDLDYWSTNLLVSRSAVSPRVLVYGLDLFQDCPESLALLDILIDFCRKNREK